MFIDEATIRVKAGDGGNGCIAFRREEFVPRGGPLVGGGEVAMSSWNPASATTRLCTFVLIRIQGAARTPREGSNNTGKIGMDVLLKVPVGTIVYDFDTGEKVYDFSRPDERIIIAAGGRGGRGNARFATSTHQAPREHEEGRPGEERTFRLELKLLADVALIGYPNVGKSTLISRISAARPKIADYPFTTLQPNLGVVVVGRKSRGSFVVADIPGLIEGAHSGEVWDAVSAAYRAHAIAGASGGCVGWERTARPCKGCRSHHGRAGKFWRGAGTEAGIMVASKIDVANKDKLAKLKRYCKKKKLELFPISAVTGKGIEELMFAMAEKVEEARKSLQESAVSD